MTILPPPLQSTLGGVQPPYLREFISIAFEGRQNTLHINNAPLGERPSSSPPEDWGTESKTGFFVKLLDKLRAH